MKQNSSRRGFLAVGAAAIAAGCSKISKSPSGESFFDAVAGWHKSAQRLIGGRYGLAPEYSRDDLSPFFRGNGSQTVDTPEYRSSAEGGFEDWQLTVGGLVENPLTLSMENIRRLPQRTQITRHDCVEGWSAIGEWTGPQLSVLLEAAQLRPDAKYILFRCADNLNGSDYYESVDLVDAMHPQTIVAHSLNGEPLPIRNGAPLRMRIERQLGYKHAKYLTGIEAIASFDDIEGGNGGYWEDRGYQWYAGI